MSPLAGANAFVRWARTFAIGGRRTVRNALIHRYIVICVLLKSVPCHGGIWIWFLGLKQVCHPNGISISSAVFVQLSCVPDKHTDTQTTLRATSVGMFRHICVTLRSFVYYCEMSSVCVCTWIFLLFFSLPEMVNKVEYIIGRICHCM